LDIVNLVDNNKKPAHLKKRITLTIFDDDLAKLICDISEAVEIVGNNNNEVGMSLEEWRVWFSDHLTKGE